MRQLLPYLLAIGIAGGSRLVLDRSQAQPRTPPPTPNLTLQLVGTETTRSLPLARFRYHRFFNAFVDNARPKRSAGRQTLNILVLRVEFVEDADTLSTGNGRMDLVGFNTPDSGLMYDPPHTKKYFERQMQFVANYYKSNSFGNLIVNATVKPDYPTQGYQLPHRMSYYSGFDHYDALSGYVYYNTYAMEMGMVRIVADAIAAADLDPTVDFSQYDNIVVFHAGSMLQSSLNFRRFYDIPSATIPPGAVEYYLGVPYFVVDQGTDTVECNICLNSEMARVDEYLVGALGTTTHEFGHILDLPDLYDVTGYSTGVGAYDLMGTGGWLGDYQVGVPEGTLPGCCGAWVKYWLGWVSPVTVVPPDTGIVLRAAEIDTTQYALANQTMIKIPISPTEYYLVENRQQDVVGKDTIIVDVEDGVPVSVDNGEYDFFLPGSGILIWHIDDQIVEARYASNTIQVNPSHKGIDVEEADGIQHFDGYWNVGAYPEPDPEYLGSRFDFFFREDSGPANHVFGPFTNPNSDSYYGKSLLTIDVRSTLDTLMTIDVTHDLFQDGFPLTLASPQPVHAVSHGDFDNDGDREILAVTANGRIYIYHHDGSAGGNVLLPAPTSFPAVGDINGDGHDDIVIAADRRVYAVGGSDLSILPGFPVEVGDLVAGAPLLFDLDGDGMLNIVFGSRDRRLYCVDGAGTSLAGFPIYLNAWLFSTPCVFDPATRTIGVLGSDGRFWLVTAQGVAREFTNSLHNMLTYASPVVGDIDRDGDPEAVIINGYGTVYIYGADSLEEKFEIWIDSTFYYTPGLADLDRDGLLEIIVPNSTRTIYVCNRNGTPENGFPMETEAAVTYPLCVADLENTGRPTLVYGRAAVDSTDHSHLVLIDDRTHERSYSPLFGDGGFSTPGVVVDVDGDGDLELICGTSAGKLYAWDFPGTTCDWSGYMNDPTNSGRFTGTLGDIPTSTRLLGECYLYPSPVKRVGHIRVYLFAPAELRIDILDISGHSLIDAKVERTTAPDYNELAIDLSRQPNGIYILRVEADDGTRREVSLKKFAILK